MVAPTDVVHEVGVGNWGHKAFVVLDEGALVRVVLSLLVLLWSGHCFGARIVVLAGVQFHQTSA